jgi:hypothetical protein
MADLAPAGLARLVAIRRASSRVRSLRIIQVCADSTFDPLLLTLADYASFVEAVSLQGHQSGRRPVIDRKDCSHVQCALHGCITTRLHAQFPGDGSNVPSAHAPMALAP